MRQKHNRIKRPLVLYCSANGFGADAFDGEAVFSGFDSANGTIDTEGILCEVSAPNGEYINTSLVEYKALSAPLDCSTLRERGLSKLNFTGNYSVSTMVSGFNIYAYSDDNVYSSFIALVSNLGNITAGTSGISNASKKYQVTETFDTDGDYFDVGFKNKSGDFVGSIDIPVRGSVYLAAGALQKNLRAKTTLTLTDIWLS